jgi:hypothetical protein
MFKTIKSIKVNLFISLLKKGHLCQQTGNMVYLK